MIARISALAALGVLGLATPAAAEPELPRVSIEVSDGQPGTAPGARHTYRIVVHSYEQAELPGMTVQATVAGRPAPDWKAVTVPAGGAWGGELLVTVPGRPPSRVDVVACVVPQGFDRPAVCASDLNPVAYPVAKPVTQSKGYGLAALAGAVVVLGTALAAGRLVWAARG
ncbi:hypothetical protein [Longispora albida]|uniref:hypothetical protein n=1 Tax=Longispora albida TaxID=203523 RepID=UPI0003790CFE|nr:hypothetical protein [Longispora albida]